ncbi:MAG: glycosyltransferase [Mobilitalea sp.]
MKTGIVIVTFNKLEYTKLCIDSILRFTNKDSYEIIVVDNASSDDTPKWLSSQNDLKVIINAENLGFPKACNQGIEAIDKDCDSVLLLNNDTVVTENWLTNLRTALLSDDSIGAVGAITNNITYFQNMHTDYKDLDEMQVFARNHNISDPKKWEDRLKLVGYCMLIKKTVIDRIGYLDERFTPGNYEDNDYSLRIRNAGYRLLFCKDTFIHHFGSVSFKENSSYGTILKSNYNKYIEKWNYDPDSAEYIDRPVALMISKHEDKPIRVLEIGCRCGGTLLKVKYKYPNAELYGVECHDKEREYASNLVNTFATVTELEKLYSEEFFDVIIISNMRDNSTIDVALKQITPYLKKDGVLISVLPNLLYNRSTNHFLQERPGKKESQYIELDEVKLDFHSAGFEQVKPLLSIGEEHCDLDIYIKVYDQKIADANEEIFRIGRFYVRSTFMKKEALDMQVQEILDNPSHEKLRELFSIDTADLIQSILSQTEYPIEMFNKLAIHGYNIQIYDIALELLSRAIEIDPFSLDTLYNLAVIHEAKGEYHAAITWLEKIENPTEDIKQFKDELKAKVTELEGLELQNEEIKHALRRIENDVELEESVNQVLDWLVENEENLVVLAASLDQNIIHKVKVLNQLAVTAFHLEQYEMVIPLLEHALYIDPLDAGTLYNLAFVLVQYGEIEIAKGYLEKISTEDDNLATTVRELTEAIENK